MGLAWMALAVAGSSWQVDASSARAAGDWLVRTHLACPPEGSDSGVQLRGQPLRTLGVAVVVYSRKQGTMAWGHASLRAVGCLGAVPFDVEYESYVVGPRNAGEIERVLAGQRVLDDAKYWRRQRGRRFLFRNDDPVDAGYFAKSHAANREIYELWLDPSTTDPDGVVLALEAQLDDQQARLDARDDLEGRYRALSTNCTMPIQQLLGRSWHLPFRWLRELQADAVLRVLHPSHHLLASWSTVPTEVAHRPTPVWRRRLRDADRVLSELPRAPVLPAEALGGLKPTGN